jgi:hypothetical protein
MCDLLRGAAVSHGGVHTDDCLGSANDNAAASDEKPEFVLNRRSCS